MVVAEEAVLVALSGVGQVEGLLVVDLVVIAVAARRVGPVGPGKSLR